MQAITKVKGFPDLFSPESDKYSRMESVAREVFIQYGFQEVRLPVLERTELFARSIGDQTDIVQKEMYTFPDRKKRSLTLRPEATAGLVRSFIENKLYARDLVTKLYTFGPMFRYERPQKGRMRQFHQIDAEIIGTPAPQADAELLLMLWGFLQRLEVGQLSLELNSLGCPQCRPAFQQALIGYLERIDKKELCQDCLTRSATNPLRVLDCKVQQCRTALEQAPTTMDFLCQDCRVHIETVRELLAQAGIPHRMNHLLVRGLDYYQRTTFEVVSGAIGSQSSVAGGGRYDTLISDLGGPDVPALGFACGMERLAMLMQDAAPDRPDFYLAVLDETARNTGVLLAQQLRDKGFSGEASYEAKSPKSLLRLANRIGAKTCLLLGPEEMASGKILVKDMQTGVQNMVSQDELEQALGLKAQP
ncbi:MAG: histidine--tRNA ligase [Desulfohalobiaceae bacterium]